GWIVWGVHKSGLGLGTPSAWGRILLAYAETIIAENKQDRIWAAQMYFLRSHIFLAMRDFGSDDWARAVVGETRAIEELIRIETSTDPNSSYERDRAPEIYQKAIEALKRAGRDASEVQSRLDRIKLISDFDVQAKKPRLRDAASP